MRYKELSTTPLERALSPRGRGSKRYEVRFPAGRSMTIHATNARRYADLMRVPELESIAHVEGLIRPGARVLILGVGTGAPARLVAGWVGPYGGLVAVDHDNESIRFARRRYRIDGVSFERGGVELLDGELDGSFDVSIITGHWLARCDRPEYARAQAWRVTAPGGRMILVGDTAAGRPAKGGLRGARVSHLAPPGGGPALLVLDKPGRDPANPRR